MHILILANIYPYETGGAEIQARDLAEVWFQQGYRITIAGNRIPTDKIESSDNSNNHISIIHLPTININRFMRAITYTVSLSWLLFRRKKDFDLIYCRFIKDAAIVVSILKKIHFVSVPLVVCAEGAGETGDAEFLKNLPCTTSIITLINKECDAVNILSPEIEHELIELNFTRTKFSYIPNGIYLATPHQHKIFSDRKKIIFIGRLCKQKGITYLFKAISLLSKNNFKIKLTVIGDGPYRKHLEYVANELQILDILKFTGVIKHEDIFSQLNKHDIFVLPSLCEGFGIAVIEAMSAGLPVIVTKCGGPEHFVDNTVGRVAEAGDADSLKNALQELLELSNEQLYAMGQAARERVKQNYDIKTVADKHIELFKQYI